MDELDKKIISILRRNSRTTNVDMAKAVGLA
jgi:DNA-binding Lrp family transcriptional regulator